MVMLKLTLPELIMHYMNEHADLLRCFEYIMIMQEDDLLM